MDEEKALMDKINTGGREITDRLAEVRVVVVGETLTMCMNLKFKLLIIQETQKKKKKKLFLVFKVGFFFRLLQKI